MQSERSPKRYYTGLTSNVRLRLANHNGGHSRHTANGRPWRMIVVVAFATERRAIEFEKYLKSGSGCAFSVRHFR
jgi:putative endonuclease